MGKGLVVFCCTGVLAASVVAATAAAGSYSVAATRGCLTHHGAIVADNATTSLPSGMSAAHRAEVILASVPDGSGPAYLYLAIGRSARDAAATLKALTPVFVPGTTKANSWTGASANAAWRMVSLAGKPPTASARKTLLNCLTGGSAAATATAVSPTRLTTCLGRDGKAVSVPGSQLLGPLGSAMFGRPLPSSLATDLFLVQTSTSSSTKDGVGIVLVVRKTHAQSVHQLLAVQRGVGLTRPGVFSGSAKNVAWYAYRHRGTTAAGVAAAQKLLLGCLAVT